MYNSDKSTGEKESVEYPFTNGKYRYIGKDNDSHTYGKIYTVTSSGVFWDRTYGSMIWVTTDSNKYKYDTAHQISVGLRYFRENFSEV